MFTLDNHSEINLDMVRLGNSTINLRVAPGKNCQVHGSAWTLFSGKSFLFRLFVSERNTQN